MAPEYPNLELLEYITKQSILQSEVYKKKKEEYKERGLYPVLEFRATVFSQMWGNTCGGIDCMPDGSPAFGGCAMTEQYTTIIHERTTDTYAVFFGGRPAYVVNNAPECFFEDMRKHNMAPLSEGKKKY